MIRPTHSLAHLHLAPLLRPQRRSQQVGLGRPAGRAGVGDEIDDAIVPRLQQYADVLADRAKERLSARLQELTEEAKPYVRQLADEALQSDGAQQAKKKLEQAFITTTVIGVIGSFVAAFLAEAWEMRSKRR